MCDGGPGWLQRDRLARVRAAFFAAAFRSAGPFVRTAFFAAAFRLLDVRFFAAFFACRESAPREAVDFGSRFNAFSRACDRRGDVFFADVPDCPFS